MQDIETLDFFKGAPCMDENDREEQATQISIHSMKNLLGSRQQLEKFSEEKVKEFSEVYGVTVEKEFSSFGVDLTDLQQKMLEALLHGFTKTNYQGNLDPLEIPSIEKYPLGKIPNSYKNISMLPRLRTTQSQILEWAGINSRSAGSVQLAIKALEHLGSTQYCFYYTRLAYDENGNPKKDKYGAWVKEEVTTIDKLFVIKEIRNVKTGVLEYYEATPSPIFLDQRESFYLLIPFNWREEVKVIIGQRRAYSYTFRFLMFLRLQFEMQRRASQENKNYVIKWTSEEIAINLKMPESIYKRKKDRANTILDEVYSIAKSLGYLTSYQRTKACDILYLNEEKYLVKERKEKLLSIVDEKEEVSPEMEQAKEILALLIQEKKKIDPKYKPLAGGQIRERSLQNIMDLLKTRTSEEIKKVILWGLHKPYWVTRLGAPANLKKHFTEAYAEMKVSEGKEEARKPEKYKEDNKNFAIALAREMAKNKNSKITVEVLNNYIEVKEGAHAPASIKYEEKGFMEQLDSAFRKRGALMPSISD